jgi:hypothetical protein
LGLHDDALALCAGLAAPDLSSLDPQAVNAITDTAARHHPTTTRFRAIRLDISTLLILHGRALAHRGLIGGCLPRSSDEQGRQ